MPQPLASTDEIVMAGLCIGCGLCADIAAGDVEMAWTPELRLRPVERRRPGRARLDAIAATCPGLVAEGLSAAEAAGKAESSLIWGWTSRMLIGWAGDPHVRFESSAGGVLNALAIHLLNSRKVAFVLHTGPDPDNPVRSTWRISETRTDVLGSSGSRYGPAAPLEALSAALARKQPFAFIGKPCDVGALRLRQKQDRQLAQLCRYRLTLMCGGASELAKTLDLLEDWGMREEDVVSFRYRGNGNPGPCRAIARDGRTGEATYNEMWDDEAGWRLQHRCKICPDAIGEAADLVALDCWPGGGPVGEDEGFNAIVTRTEKGDALLDDALTAGALVAGRTIGLRDLDDFQPHQVRKKQAVWARLAGQRHAGLRTTETHNLRIAEIARTQAFADLLREARGLRMRARTGRVAEPRPVAASSPTKRTA